ncbi:unnamed protein product, partial [Pylaiella littoralis]
TPRRRKRGGGGINSDVGAVTNFAYNKQCTRSRQRLKLCEDNPDCRRWVHKSHAHE